LLINNVSIVSEAEPSNESVNDFSFWENLDLKGPISNCELLEFIPSRLRFKRIRRRRLELAFESYLATIFTWSRQEDDHQLAEFNFYQPPVRFGTKVGSPTQILAS